MWMPYSVIRLGQRETGRVIPSPSPAASNRPIDGAVASRTSIHVPVIVDYRLVLGHMTTRH